MSGVEERMRSLLEGKLADLQAQRDLVRKSMRDLTAQDAAIGKQISDCIAAGRVFALPLSAADDLPSDTVRNLILSILHAAPDGMKAREIQERLDLVRPGLHQKTVGMTLYRLMRDGIVRRDKRTWRTLTQEPKSNG